MIRNTNVLRNWIRTDYDPELRRAVCFDFATFATDHRSAAVNQQTRLLSMKHWDSFDAIAPNHFKAALQNLQKIHLVMIQDYTSPLGIALTNYTFGGDFDHATFEAMVEEADLDGPLPSTTNKRSWPCSIASQTRGNRCQHTPRMQSLIEQIESNTTLMALVEEANK